MSQQRAVLSAFKLQKSLSHPFALMRTARIGVVNRYRYVSCANISRSPVRKYRHSMAICILENKISSSNKYFCFIGLCM